MHHTITQELYKHIVLGHSADSLNKGNFRLMAGESCWDTIRLLRLSSVLKTTPQPQNQIVESLHLELDSNTLHESFGCSDLMLYLPSLKSLYLSSKRYTGQGSGQQLSCLSPFEIGQRLQGVSATLESLTIDIDQSKDLRDSSGIGTLRPLIALKHLSIQFHVLFGNRGDCIFTNSTGEGSMMALTRVLPLGLQQLQISCSTYGPKELDIKWVVLIVLLLEKLVKVGLGTLPELHRITVYYPTKGYERRDLGDDWASERDLEYDGPRSLVYAKEGLWQKMAETLEGMALEKHRTLAVRFKRGSQNGSRPWGETATEAANAES